MNIYKQLNQLNAKIIAVQLSGSELRYDIDFITNRLSRFVSKDKDGNVDSDTAASYSTEDPDNNDYISRLLTSALALLKTKTSWCSGNRGSRMVTDEIPEDEYDYNLVFQLPLNWRGDAAVLCSLIHDYIKNRVVCEWLTGTASSLADNYEKLADNSLAELTYELRKQPPSSKLYDLYS